MVRFFGKPSEKSPSKTSNTTFTSDQNVHKRFANVAAYVKELGGDKSHVIEKVLIANNGVAAVKAIRSIRGWAYDVFGDERAIQFVVMATPEDLRANAEYIRMGDVIIDVPGGSNNHNYANITLIVELARLNGVHAVWAGWGHASENPILPDTLAQSNPPIKFIGPAGPPMRALGDKIGSTIIAQTAGVPCISWNGDGVFAQYDRETGCLPEGKYRDGTIASATEAYEASKKIGFPVMIKASEGGGGKGIRMVDNAEDVPNAFRQVCGEVPGSPIFIMKLSSNSRHLEVQLLADEYGDAVALNGRDCSVQRRHQKIIEEGPPIAAPPLIWDEMEKAAVALAKAVGYTNAGTVEYLYSTTDQKFYFLELNPRLQVEHPVTEMITGINLPAAQLQVAMGIKLYHIPEVRELYGKNRFENNSSDGSTRIDFDITPRIPARGHCMAVRITAENAEAGFKPTSGGIQELNFRSTPSVWGYFSMDSSGSIHEYADSQFGHLFANGKDREDARRNMVLALKELSIRGDISTNVDYISKLIEFDDFVSNNIDTGWLDVLIKENVDGIGIAGGLKRSASSAKVNSLGDDASAVIGALVVAFDQCSSDEKLFLDALQKGQLPSQTLLSVVREVELILDGIKYQLCCTRNGPNRFSIALAGIPQNYVEAYIRRLSDGGYLTDIGGKSRVAYLTSAGDAAIGMRMTVGGQTISFSPDYNPNLVRTDVAGRLVKKLVSDGAHVEKGQACCEIEVMKMFMPLKVTEAGVLTWKNNEGAALAPGDLIASLELDNPENVATATIFEGDLCIDGWNVESSASTKTRPHLLLRKSFVLLNDGMSGFILNKNALQQAMDDISLTVTDPSLPIYEVGEPLSVLSGRIDASLFRDLSKVISDFKSLSTDSPNLGPQLRFPAEQINEMISDYAETLDNQSDKDSFTALIGPLVDAAAPYTKSDALGVGGSERALQEFLKILRRWVDIELWFCEGNSYADSVDKLRKSKKENYGDVLAACRTHARLESTTNIVVCIIDIIADALRVDLVTTKTAPLGRRISPVTGAHSLGDAIPSLSEIGSMGGSAIYGAVAMRARKILLQESLPSIEQRKLQIIDIVRVLQDAVSEQCAVIPSEVIDFVDENVPLSDVFYPLLNEFSSNSQRLALAELQMRKLYRAQTLKEFSRDIKEEVLKFTFIAKPSESVFSATTPVSSMTDLRAISRSSSMQKLGESSDNDSDGNLLGLNQSNQIPSMTPRTAICKLVQNMEELESVDAFEKILASFPQYGDIVPKYQAGPINVLYIIMNQCCGETPEALETLALKLEGLLSTLHNPLKQADIRRISFIFNHATDDLSDTFPLPAILTFRYNSNFSEDTLFRNIEPSHAYQLDLNRLAENFVVNRLDSRQTATCNVHLYKATPRRAALSKDLAADKGPRIFVRMLSFVLKFSSGSFERMFVDALNALDISVHENGFSTNNHLFMNLVSDYERIVLDPVVVEQAIVMILKRHSDRVAALGLTEVETKLVCCLSTDSPPIALRMVASNPTGYVHVMNTYVESADASSSTPTFKLIGETKATLASSGDGSWEGMKVTSPYPLTRPFDSQRKAALRASDSLYCYDLPALFEAVVEQQWSDTVKIGGSITAGSRPLMVMYTSELIVQHKRRGLDSWDMQDYLNGDLELSQIQRSAGGNNVGMVAWLMTLNTVEYPHGRQVVLIANDITHKAGSFGTREDVVFKLASEFARASRIPRLYVAANSGARIGLAEHVKKRFKVAFKDPKKPENGFDFLYLAKDDFDMLNTTQKQVIAVPATYKGEEVYQVTDIIGIEPDLGVENLKGSGLIAGETSTAYNEIFTMTIVLGRTVGIGAYLVRLGQRTIQKTSESPIILTGYQALNKLMGVDVYSTNDQLGGPSIMHANGISHLTAPDHLRAIMQAMEWLSFVPSIRGSLLPITDIRGIDNIDRPISFMPSPGIPYDPRFLLIGTEDSSGNWLSGFFDKGSFVETLAGWAKSVVVGRARLGGIPMGVIATENRTSEAVKPADPADVKASEAIIQEAGCVWFPNSAYKTSQAINDFRTEDLPLIVFANWRGFSGGQRDMFDEVLKYGSLIVDAFVAYEQPVFVLIPPFAEIRGGAWVVLDASINKSVMEMYASAGSARGGVLEANGAASVKYRVKDLLKTMHRLDDKLKALCSKLESSEDDLENIERSISQRENELLPVYEQIAVQFCELHDTPGRMDAVGVIEREIEWSESRSFFFWRLRRKLAEFDLRRKMVKASDVGRGRKSLSSLEASSLMKEWFLETPSMKSEMWKNDKKMLAWMAENNKLLEEKVLNLATKYVAEEVFQAMTGGGNTAHVGTAGITNGVSRAFSTMNPDQREIFKQSMKEALQL